MPKARTGSKAGVVVKRGAGGKIMGSVSTGAAKARGGGQSSGTYRATQGSKTEHLFISGKSVTARTYFAGTPGRPGQEMRYTGLSRSDAASQIKTWRRKGLEIKKIH